MCLHDARGTPKPINLKNDRKMSLIFELVELRTRLGDGPPLYTRLVYHRRIRDEHTYGFDGSQGWLGYKSAIALVQVRYSFVG